jgi:hypothetical protein
MQSYLVGSVVVAYIYCIVSVSLGSRCRDVIVQLPTSIMIEHHEIDQ